MSAGQAKSKDGDEADGGNSQSQQQGDMLVAILSGIERQQHETVPGASALIKSGVVGRLPPRGVAGDVGSNRPPSAAQGAILEDTMRSRVAAVHHAAIEQEVGHSLLSRDRDAFVTASSSQQRNAESFQRARQEHHGAVLVFHQAKNGTLRFHASEGVDVGAITNNEQLCGIVGRAFPSSSSKKASGAVVWINASGQPEKLACGKTAGCQIVQDFLFGVDGSDQPGFGSIIASAEEHRALAQASQGTSSSNVGGHSSGKEGKTQNDVPVWLSVFGVAPPFHPHPRHQPPAVAQIVPWIFQWTLHLPQIWG